MGAEKPCDTSSASVFIIGLIAGTGCIIVAKMLFEMKAVGSTGELEIFNPPVFESFVMFFGMLFALPVWAIGEFVEKLQARGDLAKEAAIAAKPKISCMMLMSLGVPAIFDLSSVLLMMAGLSHISASMWMLLRGGCIVFVALMKQFVLGDKLTAAMWVGVSTITVAVLLVGLSSTMVDDDDARRRQLAEAPADEVVADASTMTMGVLLTLAGTFMQSLQYVYEEKVSAPAPRFERLAGRASLAACRWLRITCMLTPRGVLQLPPPPSLRISLPTSHPLTSLSSLISAPHRSSLTRSLAPTSPHVHRSCLASRPRHRGS